LQPTAARWWTFFGDPGRHDPFHDPTKDLLGETQVSIPSREQFELDVAERRSDLAHRAGPIDVEGELIRWTSRMDPGQVRGLYASMITVLRRPQPDQQRLLDALVAIAAGEVGGVVERPFITALYTARHPVNGGRTGASVARRSARTFERGFGREFGALRAAPGRHGRWDQRPGPAASTPSRPMAETRARVPSVLPR